MPGGIDIQIALQIANGENFRPSARTDCDEGLLTRYRQVPKCRQYPPFALHEDAKDEISLVGVVDEETQRNDLDIGSVNSSRLVGYREPNRWRQSR